MKLLKKKKKHTQKKRINKSHYPYDFIRNAMELSIAIGRLTICAHRLAVITNDVTAARHVTRISFVDGYIMYTSIQYIPVKLFKYMIFFLVNV